MCGKPRKLLTVTCGVLAAGAAPVHIVRGSCSCGVQGDPREMFNQFFGGADPFGGMGGGMGGMGGMGGVGGMGGQQRQGRQRWACACEIRMCRE